MEIRDKVSQYVKERCVALRREHPGSYENISCIRTNSMKYLPNFFKKGQLTKLFFLFPDPHFKTANHRRRIIQRSLLTEYAYTLAVGGIMYTITDVEELGTWMSEKISAGGPGPFAFAAALTRTHNITRLHSSIYYPPPPMTWPRVNHVYDSIKA